MKPEYAKKRELRQAADRKMIFDAIEASMQLSRKKGPHALEPRCNCIACVNKRKRILAGPLKPWRYRL